MVTLFTFTVKIVLVWKVLRLTFSIFFSKLVSAIGASVGSDVTTHSLVWVSWAWSWPCSRRGFYFGDFPYVWRQRHLYYLRAWYVWHHQPKVTSIYDGVYHFVPYKPSWNINILSPFVCQMRYKRTAYKISFWNSTLSAIEGIQMMSSIYICEITFL